ncbi:hypothetical protein BsWGS_23206 [Bradybaena similaris]
MKYLSMKYLSMKYLSMKYLSMKYLRNLSQNTHSRRMTPESHEPGGLAPSRVSREQGIRTIRVGDPTEDQKSPVVLAQKFSSPPTLNQHDISTGCDLCLKKMIVHWCQNVL